MTDEQFQNFTVSLAARGAQLDSVNEKIDIIEEYLAKSGVKLNNSDAKKVYRARTFSQFGEDSWIRKHVDLPEKGYFIEVGAADGITNSNTYWLEKMGWTGVCFEPDPRNFLSCSLYRDHAIQQAVGKESGEMTFSQAAMSPDWSGLNIPVEAKRTISVTVTTLNKYLEDNNIEKVDFVSIDVEGTELDVLNGFSLEKYKPTIVILEFLSPMNNISEQLTTYMTEHQYKVVQTTFSNLIFVPNDCEVKP